jgi:hypothetical protein
MTLHDTKLIAAHCDDDIDPRLALLARASAHLTLVELGEMDLDEAIDDLVPAFEELRGDSFEALVERLAKENKARAKSASRNRSTPDVVVEAILHCVRERGPKALKEPANIERLRRCDAAAKAQIDQRIEKLIKCKGNARD